MSTTTTNSFLMQPILRETEGSILSNCTEPKALHKKTNVLTAAVVSGCLLISPVGYIQTKAAKSYTTNVYYGETSRYSKSDSEGDVINAIRAYQDYPVNWDGYDGIPPTAETVNDVSQFIDRLPRGVVRPRSGLSGDGEINLFWGHDDTFVNISFIGDGIYAFYAKDSQSVEYFGDDVDLSGSIPDALLSLIKKKS